MATDASAALQSKIDQSKAKGKKALPADMADVSNMLDVMRSELQHMKSACAEELQASASKIWSSLEATKAAADKGTSDATKALEISSNAKEELRTLRVEFDRDVGELKYTVQAHSDGHLGLQEELRTFSTNEITAVTTKVTEKLNELENGATAGTQRLLRELQAALEERIQQLESRITEAREHAGALNERGVKAVLSELTRTEGDLSEQCGAVRGDLSRLYSSLDLRHAAVDSTLQRLENATQSSLERLEEATGTLAELKERAGSRLETLEQQGRTMEASVSEVANITTRRVEWVVSGVCLRMNTEDPPSPVLSPAREVETSDTADEDAETNEAHSKSPTPVSPTSYLREGCRWLSPPFQAAGSQGLQLELRFLGDADGKEEQTQSSKGDFVVCLHSHKQLYLAFKFIVGKETVQLQHSFNAQQPCCVSKRLGFLDEKVDSDTDTMQIGFEILEAVSEIEVLPPSAEAEDGAIAVDSNGEGKLTFKRYLNHRLMEQVRGQVDLMRSRLVRRIEWHIDQASSLQRCFPEGHPICSAPFVAAGLEGLQLVFYPSGYTGVKEGYCSLFLYCPAGTFLRCWLSAGSQRREARLSSDTRPGFFGRTNFCRFENTMNQHDDVVLVLEIDEAQQDIKEKLSHSLKRATSAEGQAPAQAAGAPTNRAEGQDSPPSVESTLKLQRVAGKGTLEDVKLLPSIWTPRPQASVDEVLEGYHSVGDYKSKKTANGRSGRTPRSVGVPWKEGSLRSEVTSPSTMSQKYVMYTS
mmetsp:Transcript_22080/g.50473  ORF Transcript_22080/g.50473 Transcript_22080/m.50473 type:complete len:759 (-) Transcript_22080:26-2302(-)